MSDSHLFSHPNKTIADHGLEAARRQVRTLELTRDERVSALMSMTNMTDHELMTMYLEDTALIEVLTSELELMKIVLLDRGIKPVRTVKGEKVQ